jgi:quinol monooxygenase YgiN
MKATETLHGLGQSLWLDLDALAAQLQEENAKAFVKSWNDLLAVFVAKSAVLKR